MFVSFSKQSCLSSVIVSWSWVVTYREVMRNSQICTILQATCCRYFLRTTTTEVSCINIRGNGRFPPGSETLVDATGWSHSNSITSLFVETERPIQWIHSRFAPIGRTRFAGTFVAISPAVKQTPRQHSQPHRWPHPQAGGRVPLIASYRRPDSGLLFPPPMRLCFTWRLSVRSSVC